MPGVGQALLFGKLNYSMRIWFDTQRLTACNLAPSDIVAAIQAQNVQAPVGRIGARPVGERPAVPDQRADAGPPDHARAVRQHRAARQSGRLGAARPRRRAGRDRRRRTWTPRAGSTADPAVAIGDLSRARRQCGADRGARCRPRSNGSSQRFPDGLKARVSLRHSTFVARHDPRGAEDARRGLRPGRDRRLPVPRQPARHHHPGGRRAGQPDRHLRRAAAVGYSANTVSLLAHGAGDRHRGRRRDRRGRERRARDGGGARTCRPPRRPRRRCRRSPAPIIAITLVLLSVFVPVAFIPGISGQLFRQFAVTISVAMLISAINALTLSPALCARVPAPPRPAARADAAGCCGGIDRVRDGYAAVVHAAGARVGAGAAAADRWSARHLRARRASRRPASCRRRTRARSSSPCSCPTAPRWRAPARRCGRSRRLLKQMPQVQDVLSIIGFSLLDGANEPNAAFAGRRAEAVRGPPRRGRFGAGADRPHVRRGRSRSAPPT